MDSGQPGESAAQLKKRSCLAQLRQDTDQKLGAPHHVGLILHVVKSPTASILAALCTLGAVVGTAVASPAAGHPTVMLDPGHGGTNHGATGVGGLREKQLSLIIAGRVADKLKARGIEVQMTRSSDRTLTLRQRVALADRGPADLFVSIHANASPTKQQRGYETFVLTARGIDVDGRALRGEAMTPRPGVDGDTALVLDDVERGASQWEAAELAARMQHAIRARRGGDGDRGVRQDAQHVLLGATMPAVLVEVGFIDHPVEGRQLSDPAVQAGIADAISDAIVDQLAD